MRVGRRQQFAVWREKQRENANQLEAYYEILLMSTQVIASV
jgi:hypothetical protein